MSFKGIKDELQYLTFTQLHELDVELHRLKVQKENEERRRCAEALLKAWDDYRAIGNGAGKVCVTVFDFDAEIDHDSIVDVVNIRLDGNEIVIETEDVVIND